MSKKFVFRSNQTIGAASAESDAYYLNQCFVLTGDSEILKNNQDPRNILVGRTGIGKSALILRLAEEEENVIQISPESLSLSYISNSNVLRFFTDLGVKMDIFYRLLWRHIFCVEILKARFNIDSEDKKQSFLERLWSLVPKSRQDEVALDYLKKWGESFWQETEYRIKEVTAKVENELRASVEGKVPDLVSLNAGAVKTLSTEQKADIVHRAQEVINGVQIKELSNVMRLIDKVLLADRKQKYYIVTDRLDEDWVEDKLRFRLIRALIETGVDFTRIENIKIIIAVRSDLLDRVYRYTRDAGFQEEKYQSCTLDIAWTRSQLIQVLDTRIWFLVKHQYTDEVVTHEDLLPKRIGKQLTIDYMLDRTLMRPRDIIQFFNACIKRSDNKAVISTGALREAEGYYSRDRLKALFDEWYGLYPNLPNLFQVLKGKNYIFSITDLTQDELDMNLLQVITSGVPKTGEDYELMDMRANGKIEYEEYRRQLVFIFYKVALVGLKIDSTSPFSWSHLSGVSISSAEIGESTKIQVHKTFWRVLGVFDGIQDASDSD